MRALPDGSVLLNDNSRRQVLRFDATLKDVREVAEREAIVRVLSRSNGNLSRAAEMLGISRPTLYDLLNRFGLKEATR